MTSDPKPKRDGMVAFQPDALTISRGETLQIEPWDWRFYAEKVRKADYGFDAAARFPKPRKFAASVKLPFQFQPS